MQTRNLSLVFTITGFIYTTTLFFIFLLIFGIYDLTGFLSKIDKFLPYLAIIIFFFSFVVGIVFELLGQRFVFLIRRKSYDAKNDIKIITSKSEILRTKFYNSFHKLLILRHSILGLILLVGSSSLWLVFSKFKDKYQLIEYILSSGIFFIILFIWAYRIHTKMHKQLEKEVRKVINEKT